ncbi:MAG TPA: single-stranded DNA-binding protein [Lachnospiraceae bacterium]|jgi:single-strand DNA-binding protein|nr:single-stranded DNA-binding protein [Lachnospiraceae bacterium]HBY71613.1 single-stranded DNA-binding protein [Lachnospiraceae bacterium]HCA69346.1 single-stranded DNA-binding protein [Lachnospiraceae bacterium]HCM12744.1 single-stranded DNA-binding protein [Lachnospiraceae bacterium]HCR39373.1 single-stranded DNA-binding protein [Lachnospiraceae bacterium]
MNNVSLVGRFTRDPEVRYTDGGLSIARFSLAVDRRFKKDGQPDADFPNCVAFGKTAEFIEKYFHKGQRMGLVGRIQTGSYIKEDGTKVYTTDVVVENVEFVESKSSGSGQSLPPEPSIADANDGWVNVPDSIDEELPFN